ncbi:glycosyltransferase family 2 protein [Haemophilus sputorum]|uniref:Glycosyltransferase family 2 protein n=1 Tax=Haemophilus sputorum TaxID=1078480 RepID=A0A369YFG8_9PAST|nr:glycosyltransferase family A protein [Haemophilus sputorum]RDE70495.1 glycosyltransferase family 2 protein [Haemophilus sputorum]
MIDVIIPCFNAEKTLMRAVESVLAQPELGTLWLIDDASTDHTLVVVEKLAQTFPEQIKVESLPKNGGVAKARNWGALQSQAEFVAFLDADDAYEPNALQVAQAIFQARDDASLVRLALNPIDLPARYHEHPNFTQVWQSMRMTCGGNVVFRRAFFLACGGFPQDELFRTFGGEDGALGIATTRSALVATAFDSPGVQHYCRDGMHAERLLDALLFNKLPEGITPEHIAEAEAVTARICQQLHCLKTSLTPAQTGIIPMTITWA